jgi:rhodanese-related sulfurtransferase
MAQFVAFETAQDNFEMPGVEDIDPHEVFEKKSEVVLIDVRQPAEFTGELGHAPGAKLIVLDTLPEHIDEIPRDKTVVFICRSGGRSARATAFARDNGVTNCYNMKGGMIAWNQMGLETEGKG